MEPPAPYPTQWETHAVLKDGSTIELRPIKASDRTALAEFHGRQSRESIYFRYFRYRPELSDKELDYFTQVDYHDRMAFVAVLGDELVAVARYEKWDDRLSAEVAFFVDDDHHGMGLATLMLEYLAAAARERGLTGFTASVLAENYRMLGVFRSAGFEVSTRFADGQIEVELGIEVTAETSSVIADRQRQATARSVARILEPRSVAVIGASRHRGAVGHELVRNLVAAMTDRRDGDNSDDGPTQHIFPVNPNADEIAGLTCFATIADATAALAGDGSEQTMDLAIVAVRAELVEEVVIECAEAGVSGLLIVSVGFSEVDESGRDRELRLVNLARANGMRLIGPNAFGLINTDPEVGLSAIFHTIKIMAGRVALASQSGPLGAAVLERMRVTGAGLSTFVGIGNRGDVSVNDLLDYWDLDDRTDVIILYVEGYGNLRNFSTVARRVSENKSIVAITPAAPELAELLRQAGVILVDEVSQLAEQALLAASQPPARGHRVVIVSNAGSLARLATEACRRNGLEVVVPSSASATATETAGGDSVLIGDLDTVSLVPSGDVEDYERFVVAAAVSDEVDLVLVAMAPTAYFPLRQLAELLGSVNRAIDKPMAAIGLVDANQLDVEGMPLFTFPEEAAQAMGRHARHGLWRAARTRPGRPRPTEPTDPGPSIEPNTGEERSEEAENLIEKLLAGREEARLTVTSHDLRTLLERIDIPIAPYDVVHNAEELTEAAMRLGYPVVLKAAHLADRSVGESGGAAIDLHDNDDLQGAYARMMQQFGASMRTAVVQEMIPSTGMVRLELLQDPAFGSMVSVGQGGSGFEATPPIARRFLPLDDDSIDELLLSLVDGGAVAELSADSRAVLTDLVTRLEAAAGLSNRLARVCLNPVMVAGADTAVADVEALLRRREPDLLAGLRHI